MAQQVVVSDGDRFVGIRSALATTLRATFDITTPSTTGFAGLSIVARIRLGVVVVQNNSAELTVCRWTPPSRLPADRLRAWPALAVGRERNANNDRSPHCFCPAQPQLVPRRLLRSNAAHHPVVIEEAERRNRDFQVRLADRITAFAGSMNFVWFHAAIFAVWMLFLEKSPWPTLTLVVSLEAIFLSTFVMIGQNRQSEFQQAKADHDFEAQELERKTASDLPGLSSPCHQPAP